MKIKQNKPFKEYKGYAWKNTTNSMNNMSTTKSKTTTSEDSKAKYNPTSPHQAPPQSKTNPSSNNISSTSPQTKRTTTKSNNGRPNSTNSHNPNTTPFIKLKECKPTHTPAEKNKPHKRKNKTTPFRMITTTV